MERAIQRVFQEIRALESDMLRTLSEQTSAEKSSSKTAADIKALSAAAEAEELRIAEVQNEIARVAVDALNTQGHNERLQQGLNMLDCELKEKVSCTCCSAVYGTARSRNFLYHCCHQAVYCAQHNVSSFAERQSLASVLACHLQVADTQ